MAAVDFGDISEAFEAVSFGTQHEKALREGGEFNAIELKHDSPLPGEGGERLP